MKKLIPLIILILTLVPLLFACSGEGSLSVTLDTGDDLLTTDMTTDDLRNYLTVHYSKSITSTTDIGKEISKYDVSCEFNEGPCEIIITYKKAYYLLEAFFFDKNKISYEGDYVFYNGYKSNDYLLKYTGNETAITLPARNPYRIYDGAFAENTSLTSVNLGNYVTRIGSDAFWGCTSITRVDFGTRITEICSSAFTGCTAIQTVNVNSLEDWFKISFNILNATYEAPVNNGNMEGVVQLPILGQFTSENLGFGAVIVVPGGGLTSPETVIKNGSVYTVTDGQEIFLCYVSVSNPMYFSGSLSVGGATVTDLVVPASVTKINPNAFFGSTITSVTIHENVTSVGHHAFTGCDAIESVCIEGVNPYMLNGIGKAFNEDVYTVYQGSKYLGNSENPYMIFASEGNSQDDLVIHENTVAIASDAFTGSTQRSLIVIPASVKYIGGGAMNRLDENTAVDIGEGVIYIGKKAMPSYGTHNHNLANFLVTEGWYYLDDAGNEVDFSLSDMVPVDVFGLFNKEIYRRPVTE